MLNNIAVVLVRTKFPENIGSVARACLNMGVPRIILVDPYHWDFDKALPLATDHARHLLENIEVVPDLGTALTGFTDVFGTTARLGGWRQAILTPDRSAAKALEALGSGGKAAFVFGPEDKGLTNEETKICNHLVNIPTSPDGTSLNLSQAVLILLYECFKLNLTGGKEPSKLPPSRPIMHEEQEVLFENIKDALAAIDYLKDDNHDYWMLPVRRFFQRFTLKRHEFNLLMGVCRQIKWVADKARKAE